MKKLLTVITLPMLLAANAHAAATVAQAAEEGTTIVASSTKPLGATRQIAQFIVNTKQSDIAPEYYEHAKTAVLDWTGVALAGAQDPLVKKLVELSEDLGGAQQSGVIGYDIKVSATQAALINGAASHALDFDDSHSVFRGHASASIVATVLALADMEHKSGKDMLAAYLVGLDVGITVAKSVANSMYTQGMHNTSALGIIASAAAASHLLELNEEQTVNALAIATTQAFGLKRSFGTMSKPLHAGQAAEAAVEAALLARKGFTGASDILEGPNGLFAVFGGFNNKEALTTMGKTWGMTNLSVKYHASCHWTHGAIETMLEIAKRDGVKPEDIKSVEFAVSPIAIKTAGVYHPRSGLEGKFSIPYSAMNAVVTSKTGIQGFTEEAVKDQKVAALIDKTKIVIKQYDDWFYTETKVITKDGKIHTAAANVFEDLPGLEEKREAVTKKYTDLVTPMFGAERAKEIEDMLLSLDKIKDVNELSSQTGFHYVNKFSARGYTPKMFGAERAKKIEDVNELSSQTGFHYVNKFSARGYTPESWD